jgi:hypothetical protein
MLITRAPQDYDAVMFARRIRRVCFDLLKVVAGELKSARGIAARIARSHKPR